MGAREEGGNWNFHVVRNLNDWELVDIDWFLHKLQGQTMKREEEDRVVWKGDNKGVFCIRGLYSLLEIGCVTPFPLKIILNSWVPTKVSLFTWEACCAKVLTWINFKEEGGTSVPCARRS